VHGALRPAQSATTPTSVVAITKEVMVLRSHRRWCWAPDTLVQDMPNIINFHFPPHPHSLLPGSSLSWNLGYRPHSVVPRNTLLQITACDMNQDMAISNDNTFYPSLSKLIASSTSTSSSSSSLSSATPIISAYQPPKRPALSAFSSLQAFPCDALLDRNTPSRHDLNNTNLLSQQHPTILAIVHPILELQRFPVSWRSGFC
jgi:hypothetical protein